MTPWLIGIKYPKKLTLCDTDTVILLTIVIVIDTLFLPFPRKKVGLPIQKLSMCSVGKILKLWGEKAIAGIAIF